MGRGYVFEISSDLNRFPFGGMNADTMGSWDSGLQSECDYFQNFSDSDAYQIVENFVDEMTRCACIRFTWEENGSCFKVTPYHKEQYFKDSFAMLKDQVAAFSLEDFASDATKCCRLSTLINNDFNDAVMLDGSFYTLDDFMRSADPNTVYCLNLKRVVYMH